MNQTLPVVGMTCASCVSRVEKNLKKIHGVHSADVNLASEKVRLEYDDSIVLLEDIAAHLHEAGYELILPHEHDNSNTLIEQREQDLQSDLIISALCSLPLMILSMGMMWEPFANLVPFSQYSINTLLFVLATIVLIIPGRRFFVPAWKLALHGTADMNTLVAMGTGIAWLYSTYLHFFSLHALMNHAQHLYFDTTATIITLVLLGKMLETKAKVKAGNALKSLLSLQVTTAYKQQQDGSIAECPINEINVHDILIVRPGEAFPVDGIIIKGMSTCNESMLTGELMPITKTIGHTVSAGTINIDTSIEIRVIAIGNNTMLSRIIQSVEDAQGSKAAVQSLANSISSVFVPIVLLIAIGSFFIYFFALEYSFNNSIIPSIAIILIACPCALGLATPTAITVAIGTAAKNGIIIRNADALEKAGTIDIVAFDKTGTITKGVLSVKQLYSLQSDYYTSEYLYAVAAAIESHSLHPIAQAIVRSYDGVLQKAERLQEIPGQGISGFIDGKHIHIGKIAWLSDEGITIELDDSLLKQQHTHSILGLSIDKKPAGVFVISDTIREEAQSTIQALKMQNILSIMISGDQKYIVDTIAQQAGIEQHYAGVLPHEKLSIIESLQSAGHRIAMIGDGINDAPALAKANLSIAMGSGTDIAMNTADITILGTNLHAVLFAIRLSQKTLKIIKQNFFWAFIYNIIGIPLAAFGLLNPMVAAAAMAFSSVSVISNSLRLKNVRT